MYPDVAKVVAQPRFHIRAHVGFQRAAAARADDVMYGRAFLVFHRGGHALIADRTLQVEQAAGPDDVPPACRSRPRG